MLIRCPKCNSSFNLKREFVPQDKRLRCGACLTIFTLGDDDSTSVAPADDNSPKQPQHRKRDEPQGSDLTHEDFTLQDTKENRADGNPLEDTILEWLSDNTPTPVTTTERSRRSGTLWLVISGFLAALTLVLFSVESPLLNHARQHANLSIGQLSELRFLITIPITVVISLIWLISSKLRANKKTSVTNDDIDLLKKSAGQQRNNAMLWVFAIVLTLQCVVQIVMINSKTLSLNLSYRPAIKFLCDHSKHCDIAELKDTSQINILSKSVTSHPERDKVLLVTLSFVNNADFAQAYPKIKLSFFDYRGDIISDRVFTPEEYMPDELYYEQELQPNTPIQSHLRIVDPGKTAVNYRFELL